MSARGASHLIVVAGLVMGVAAGCYEPAFQPCTITCAAEGDACPPGFTCTDGLCAVPGGTCFDATAPYHRQIAAGAEHACAIVENAITCWGSNAQGQLALPATTTDANPVAVEPPPALAAGSGSWRSIVAGRAHTCALFAPDAGDPEIYCWGDNAFFQRGDVPTASPSFFSPTLPAGARWIGIGAGDDHSCAIAEDTASLVQSIVCWGANDRRQLGAAGEVTSATPIPVELPIVRDWRMVAGGAGHTCAVSTAAEVVCWGDNSMGQLGRSGVDPSARLIDGSFAVVAAGADHTCAITIPGAVQCWGDNTNDRLGVGSVENAVATPTPVGDAGAMPRWTALDAGPLATCGVRDGATYCWGDGHPQTGLGTMSRGQLTPVLTVADTGMSGIDVAVTSISACAHQGARDLRCWGDNLHRELGSGAPTIEWAPVQIAPPDQATWQAVYTGQDATCAVARDTTNRYSTHCWGSSSHGQLVGTAPPDIADVIGTPAVQDTASNFDRQVAIGERHLCVVYDTTLPTVEVRCWGDDSFEQNPATAPGMPFDLATSSNPEITADRHFTCVTGTDTNVPQCWGTANGTIVAPAAMPIATNAMLRPPTVVWGHESGCGAHVSDGAVWCFGTETVGELGNGGGADPLWPAAGQTQSALMNVTHVAKGPGRTRCAGNAASGIWCWGDNADGQADPASPGSPVTQPIVAVSAAITTMLRDVSVGGTHGCVIVESGNDLQCWGGFAFGQRTRLPTSTAVGRITNPTPGVTAWNTVKAGGTHTCAIADGSRLLCWGRNTYGQIGNDNSGRPTAVPVDLP